MTFQNQEDTICALSSPAGTGAISLIRLSGNNSISIAEKIFSKDLKSKESHTAHYGYLYGEEGSVLDEVIITVYKNPRSFTSEDMIEIACHGSIYIQSEILKILLNKGARLADPGEFSLRSFMNKKTDLSQTEAIADLISANSKAAHKVAMHQMRGGFSKEIDLLRKKLLDFASLIELELDFSEEDVEFADRSQLEDLIRLVQAKVNSLVSSFKLGNVIKNGVPVAIVGAPNSGKSTLLNVLLNDDKAIVSELAGTTRDVIEDTIIIKGVEFRFIDTAGIRVTKDKIESLGIERALEQIKKAEIILLIFDLVGESDETIIHEIEEFQEKRIRDDQTLIPLFNKMDKTEIGQFKRLKNKGLFISAKSKENIEELKEKLLACIQLSNTENQVIVTNVRHFEILKKCADALVKIEEGLKNKIPGDLLAMDIRESLNLLGEITGKVSNDELLGNIFSNFCIGK